MLMEYNLISKTIVVLILVYPYAGGERVSVTDLLLVEIEPDDIG